MNYDCFGVEEIISKGHKARKSAVSTESRRKLRETLKERYQKIVGNARKYQWEELVKNKEIFIQTYATNESIRHSAMFHLQKNGIPGSVIVRYVNNKGKRGVLVRMVENGG